MHTPVDDQIIAGFLAANRNLRKIVLSHAIAVTVGKDGKYRADQYAARLLSSLKLFPSVKEVSLKYYGRPRYSKKIPDACLRLRGVDIVVGNLIY